MSLKLEGIWFKYPGSERWALRNVSTEFREGEIAVITGPNGSGKTTLLKVSALLYRPLRGSVRAWGRDFWRLGSDDKIDLRRKVIYVHEKPILLKGSTLYNLAYGLLLRGYSRSEAFKAADKLIEKLGIAHLRDKPISMLSAGEAQLISILRAMAVNPRLLLLDEPVAHLDLRKRWLMVSMMRELAASGVGCVIATHDYLLAESIADRVIVLEDGSLVADDKPEQILESLREQKA